MYDDTELSSSSYSEQDQAFDQYIDDFSDEQAKLGFSISDQIWLKLSFDP